MAEPPVHPVHPVRPVRRSEDTARRRLLLRLAAAALAAGCTSPPEPPASRAPQWSDKTRRAAAALAEVLEQAPAKPLPAGALRVRLAFDADADLDLKVTDPLAETVYFANTPVRSGGALDADRRCGDAAPRVETVVFERPLPGRYRIGVDYARRCRDDAGPVAWALAIEAGGDTRAVQGLIEPLRFLPRVRELYLPPGATPSPTGATTPTRASAPGSSGRRRCGSSTRGRSRCPPSP